MACDCDFSNYIGKKTRHIYNRKRRYRPRYDSIYIYFFFSSIFLLAVRFFYNLVLGGFLGRNIKIRGQNYKIENC